MQTVVFQRQTQGANLWDQSDFPSMLRLVWNLQLAQDIDQLMAFLLPFTSRIHAAPNVIQADYLGHMTGCKKTCSGTGHLFGSAIQGLSLSMMPTPAQRAHGKQPLEERMRTRADLTNAA